MIRAQITMQNKLGLHTRAAAKLVDTAKRFISKIELVYGNRLADCKSIMNVITLGAQKNHTLEMIITGTDEEQALAAIQALVDGKFGEAE